MSNLLSDLLSNGIQFSDKATWKDKLFIALQYVVPQHLLSRIVGLLAENETPWLKNFLIENLDCVIMFFNGKTIGVDVPNSVALKVVKTDPSFKGNTVTGAQKPATLETGYVVHVPMHIVEGDTLKIDTRTGEYVERANK